MSLFEKLGLRGKKARPVGGRLESGRAESRPVLKSPGLQKVLVLTTLVIVTLVAFPRGETFHFAVQVGDEWRQETLTAPFDFPIYKSAEEIEAERRAVRYEMPPLFAEVPNAQDRLNDNRDIIREQFESIFGAFWSYQENRNEGRMAEAAEDSARHMDLRRNARVKLTSDQWNRLVYYYRIDADGTPRTMETPLDRQLVDHAWNTATQMLTAGVMDVPLDSLYTDEFVIRDEDDHFEVVRNKENVFGLNEAYVFAQDQFLQLYPDDRQAANIGVAVYRAMFSPSLRYLRSETLRAWQDRERRISPTYGRVARGDVIIESGTRVTAEVKQQLASLERERRERGGQTIVWRMTLGQLMLIIAAYLIFFLYLYLLRRSIFDETKNVVMLCLLFAGIIGLYAIAIRLPSVAMLGVPVAIAPILITVLFDSRVGIFSALTLGLIGGLLLNFNFEFTLGTVFASTLGVFSVRDIKNRGQFFLGPALVFVGYLVVLGASSLIYDTPQELVLADLMLVGLNAFLVTLAYPLVWVFERAFDMTTDLTLLELSDTNRPLLKELSLRAPGTFNHTLQVANLAEAAADAIGGQALLTRVGALYHDIGKMLKPEYFVENQRPGSNPHDQLKPRMSALIIASHVKEGLEMGRQHNLPRPVLDFIPMHHGTTRIEYFYRKAVEQREKTDPDILEAEFRYPGPRPATKETGIMMLADSVEAASRSLSEPTHKRLEMLIDMIFQARIEDGQLDDTDLTFHDLKIIKETFLSMLLGIYHVRVRYPGQEPDEKTKSPDDDAKRAAQRNAGVQEEGVWGTMDQSVSIDQVRGSDEDEESTFTSEVTASANEPPKPPEIANKDVRGSAKEVDPSGRAMGDGNGQTEPTLPADDPGKTDRGT
jgi:cyclic-di-AMP phosphodiesterase PgpH